MTALVTLATACLILDLAARYWDRRARQHLAAENRRLRSAAILHDQRGNGTPVGDASAARVGVER